MHYHCEIYISPKVLEGIEDSTHIYNTAKAYAEDAMQPFEECHGECPDKSLNENGSPDCENCELSGGIWDFFKIGGRWSGVLDGYKPGEDIKNYSPCDLCDGTGKRKDMVSLVRGCNGCNGTGMKRNFFNSPHNGDVQPLEKVPDDLTCCTMIIKGELFLSDWGPGIKVKEKLSEMGITEGYIITVDYHS